MFSHVRRTAAFLSFTCGVAALAAGASAEVNVNAAGATFPEPLYSKWVAEYHTAHPDVKINYQGIGSGGGIKGFTEKTLDFAGSDAPMNKKELEAAGGPDKIIEVPSCAGGVVPAYNVPGVKGDLKFTGELLADIYLGKVTKWNDPAIAKLNPGETLPATVITPAWRTDGSGTTYVFTNYLATQSKDFANKIGIGKQVKWLGGAGGQGTAGVAAIVKNVAGAIGYVEQNYAADNKIAFGAVQNAAGEFVKASPEAVSKAGEGVVDELKGNQLAANIWNQKGKEAYPIASFTYLIAYKDLNNVKSKEQAQALVDFLWYATHDGQKLAPAMSYAPLSEGVQKKVDAALESITFQGAAVKPSPAK